MAAARPASQLRASPGCGGRAPIGMTRTFRRPSRDHAKALGNWLCSARAAEFEGGPSSRMIQLEQSCAALVQAGRDISECFPTSLWCKQVGRFCAMASSGWTSSRPRSSASARSFACLSTDPRSSPAEPCGSLPVKPAARPRPPCPCRCGTARSSRRRPSRCTAPHSPSSGPNWAWSPAGRCAGCTSRSSLLTASRPPRGELTVATRHPVASEAPIQPVFARAIG